MQRAFYDEPGQLRFTESFRQQSRGSLLPGRTISVEFADVRIPEEPTGAANIKMHVQYDRGAPASVDLRLRAGWRSIDEKQTEPGEGNIWVAELVPPEESKQMSVWFEKIGPSGQAYYDSAAGKNYWFRFTGMDLQDLEASIGEGGFRIQVSALSEVSSVAAHYQLLNRALAKGALELVREGADNRRPGYKLWFGLEALDKDTVVSFDIVYVVDDRTFTDDNQRRHYLIPNNEKAFTAQSG